MKPIIVALLLFASLEDRTRDDWVKLVTNFRSKSISSTEKTGGS
jgi:hypothetical protein